MAMPLDQPTPVVVLDEGAAQLTHFLERLEVM